MAEGKRDTSKKRESILDAAVQAFTEQGFDNASMDYIAEIAGASKRTVYNHFASKETLFQAVIDRLMQELVALKQIPYDPERSPEEQLADFTEAKLALAENPSWLALVKVALPVFIRYPELARETMEKAEAGGDALADWLRAAERDGKLAVPDAALASKVFWAMIGGGFIWPMIFHGPMDVKSARALKEELIATFLDRYAK
jgi:TetR/AcrR family transcriptional regulator of autoinduction and epiphytic fitness